MNQPTTMQKLGATPAKLALVGVLAVVLLIVVVPLVKGKKSAPDHPQVSAQKKTKKTRPHRHKLNTNQDSGKTDKETLPEVSWPEISMEEIVKNDPMKVPNWFVQVSREKKREKQLVDTSKNLRVLEQLEELGASIVVIAEDERIATIGEQQVKIGDRIEGFEVSDITTEGVVLTEIRSQ